MFEALKHPKVVLAVLVFGYTSNANRRKCTFLRLLLIPPLMKAQFISAIHEQWRCRTE